LPRDPLDGSSSFLCPKLLVKQGSGRQGLYFPWWDQWSLQLPKERKTGEGSEVPDWDVFAWRSHLCVRQLSSCPCQVLLMEPVDAILGFAFCPQREALVSGLLLAFAALLDVVLLAAVLLGRDLCEHGSLTQACELVSCPSLELLAAPVVRY
jgi:hypothetical protein